MYDNHFIKCLDVSKIGYLFTSSADWAMKNPWVFEDILAPLGLIEILESRPSSDFSSMARRSSLSFVKHSLSINQSVILLEKCI